MGYISEMKRILMKWEQSKKEGILEKGEVKEINT
jgi:hypothetical protein